MYSLCMLAGIFGYGTIYSFLPSDCIVSVPVQSVDRTVIFKISVLFTFKGGNKSHTCSKRLNMAIHNVFDHWVRVKILTQNTILLSL